MPERPTSPLSVELLLLDFHDSVATKEHGVVFPGLDNMVCNIFVVNISDTSLQKEEYTVNAMRESCQSAEADLDALRQANPADMTEILMAKNNAKKMRYDYDLCVKNRSLQLWKANVLKPLTKRAIAAQEAVKSATKVWIEQLNIADEFRFTLESNFQTVVEFPRPLSIHTQAFPEFFVPMASDFDDFNHVQCNVNLDRKHARYVSRSLKAAYVELDTEASD